MRFIVNTVFTVVNTLLNIVLIIFVYSYKKKAKKRLHNVQPIHFVYFLFMGGGFEH